MFTAHPLSDKPGPRNIILGRVTFIPCSPPENCTLAFIMNRKGDLMIEELFVDTQTGDIYRQLHATYKELNGKWEKAQRDT